MQIQGQQAQVPLQGQSLRPIRKFSSFFNGPVQYQCVQTCYPIVPTETQIMVELCNKFCPFNPSNPECARCGQVYYMSAHPDKEVLAKKSMYTQAESLVVDPDTHAIAFKPEILVNGLEKECCYMDKCSMVPLQHVCPSVCYEPCDSACTDKCSVNPQCPNECDRIRKEQFKLRYRIWLMNKLNEIKQKYRNYAAMCLLKTRAGFVNELNQFYTNVHASSAPVALSDEAPALTQNLVESNNLNTVQSNPVINQNQPVQNQNIQPIITNNLSPLMRAHMQTTKNPMRPYQNKFIPKYQNSGNTGNKLKFEPEPFPVASEELQDELQNK